MTLPPLDSFDVVTVEGPSFKVDGRCCSPLCNRPADHAHHLFRRTRHGTSDWVRLPDDTVVGNKVPLCSRCHNLITGIVSCGHVHAIRWYENKFWWANVLKNEVGLTYQLVAPITWQPPLEGEERPEGDPALCPTCGHVARKKGKRQPARKRKRWTVVVPSDHEDGATVLDDYVEALIPVFRLDPDGGAMTRYHTLTRALAFTIVNRESIPEEAKVIEWTESL